ncbi:MAG TPA: DNA translocase FtsK [Candidatus Saccharimonadales bacterium]|jgi:S-DNA-T family DNA segregation ATPase FtsK/SpoIIIE
MAKKKKQTRSKKSAPRQPSPFWQYASAVFLILLALFVLLGGFGTGGALPISLFDGAQSGLGLAAYMLPVVLVYWGVIKFMSDNHRMPLGKLLSLFAALFIAAGFLHIVTAVQGTALDGTAAWLDGKGGAIGSFFGGLLLGALDKLPAAIVSIALFIPAVFHAFGIPLSVIWDTLKSMIPEPREREDTDLSTLKKRSKAEPIGFKINEGTPSIIEAAEPEEAPARPRFGGLKNSGVRMAATAAETTQDALTTTSDPNWQLPTLTLLNQKQDKPDAGDVNGNAAIIHDTFANFNIDVEMEHANIGPRVTQYTLKPPTNVKLTKITALENNLALDLAAHSIRMEAPIPGQRAVGIEVPNEKAATVRIGNLFGSAAWKKLSANPLGFVIGKDIAGDVVVADLAKMPHLLVAGQTGSGKSVMINTFLTSLLYHNSPSDLKLILVDPKQVEMAPYNDIPHLLCPVINEPEKCISALKWAVAEMERRLRTMADVGKRNIGEYNNLKKEEGMPYIVIVIDELADLMMMAARDVEALIVRLAQKARAAGIHLVLATQRPSVDVITGLIKANVPARIAFTVASQVDSRTIIDQMGAEKLLGRGDMLLLTSDMPKPKRVQAALIEDDETAKVTDFIKMQRPPAYDMDVISQPVQLNGKGGVVADSGSGGSDAENDMFRDAVRVVIEGKKASTSLLQRRLRIGYGRAARLIEEMEEQGIIGQADGARPREVLVSSLEQVFGGGNAEGDPAATEPEPAVRLVQ